MKTQLHAVNACVKRSSQRSLRLNFETSCFPDLLNFSGHSLLRKTIWEWSIVCCHVDSKIGRNRKKIGKRSFVRITSLISGMGRISRLQPDRVGQWPHQVRHLFFQLTFFFEIKTIVMWLKSTLLLKIKCFDTPIYMKTQCLQAYETQHYLGEEKLEELGKKW